MPEVRLTETISITEHEITDDEKLLGREYNNLVGACLNWAQKQMRYGTHSTKLALSKSVIASAARLAALDTKTQVETHRVAMQSLLHDMTVIDAATTPALAQSVVDQDEESRDQTP